MAAPGLGTNKLTLTIDGDNVTPEVSRAIITSGESDADFVSFADAAAGGAREYKLAATFVQLGVLWDLMWTAAGTEVDVIVRPFGNTTPTVAQPHFTGTVTIIEPDGDLLGGEADASTTSRFVNEVEWEFTEKPLRLTA